MADDNVDLNFIAAQLGKVLDGQREVNERLGGLEGAVSGLQADVKALPDAQGAGRVDAGISKADFEALREVQQTHWIRLNAIDDRLALIEKHTGLVKA